MYQQTRAPEDYPSGGNFSILKFTLGSMFEDLEKLRNFWTTSNQNLDLIRYLGTNIYFYRHTDVSYICIYSTCYPMEISQLSFMNAHPYRLLLNSKKIIVPSYKDAPHKKKSYIKVRIPMPKQMVNKWFFQQDFQNVGLFMLHTAGLSLNHMYTPTDTKNTTVGLYCLNPNIFQNGDFANATGYNPNNTWYYFGTEPHVINKPTNASDFIYLKSTKYTAGKSGSSNANQENWGNLLFHTYIHGEQLVWIQKQTDGVTPNPSKMTKLEQSLIIMARYNAYDDKGHGNEIWLKSTLVKSWEPTPSHDFYLQGYPLWLGWYGWLDWCRKLRPGATIDSTYTAVFRSSHLYPSLTQYVVVNPGLIHNQGPWGTPIENLTLTQEAHWYPRVANQEEAINSLTKTGPAIPRAENIQAWEAHIQYVIKGKWGGCPTKYVQITDPNSAPKYDVPDSVLLKSQIQDPAETGPENIIYSWDFKRGIITDQALQRISKNFQLTEPPRQTTKRKRTTDVDPPQPTKIQRILQETQIQASQTEEDQTSSIQLQLQQHRQQQRQLTVNILKLISQLTKEQQTLKHYTAPIE